MNRSFNLILVIFFVAGIQAKALDENAIKQKATLLYDASIKEGKTEMFAGLKALTAITLVLTVPFGIKKVHRIMPGINADVVDFLALCSIGATALFSGPMIVATGLGLWTIGDGIKKLRVGSPEDIAVCLKKEEAERLNFLEKKREAQRLAKNEQKKRLKKPCFDYVSESRAWPS